MTTRRANLGVPKNSRIAKRYTMPASAREAMKYGPPLSPKLREQIVSATHNVVPKMYSLHAGVIFIVLACLSGTEWRCSNNYLPNAFSMVIAHRTMAADKTTVQKANRQ